MTDENTLNETATETDAPAGPGPAPAPPEPDTAAKLAGDAMQTAIDQAVAAERADVMTFLETRGESSFADGREYPNVIRAASRAHAAAIGRGEHRP